ncbi:hypothetical protein L3073_05185 [Ancylomarina sp. DW003]|nr:hypothetical protein [Ancylomarina sp. DW003]MDE5421590.1 hypothetical protein [Ancylomarina sp. DW003]
MKQIAVYLLLFLFSIQSFDRALIRLNFQLNQDYYASICTNKDKPELNCNGCCHLKEQLNENEKEKTSKDKFINKKSIELYTPVSFSGLKVPVSYFLKNTYLPFQVLHPLNYCADIFHPPRA